MPRLKVYYVSEWGPEMCIQSSPYSMRTVMLCFDFCRDIITSMSVCYLFAFVLYDIFASMGEPYYDSKITIKIAPFTNMD